jgi:hypothetical protein
MRLLHVYVASQYEPMFRLSLAGARLTAGVHQSGRFRWPSLQTLYEEETAFHGYGSRLILLLTDLLPIALASKRLFHAFLFTGFQIKRMTLDFLDNVFSLHFALEAPQGILKGFAFLYSNLCQEKYTSKPIPIGIPLRIRQFVA